MITMMKMDDFVPERILMLPQFMLSRLVDDTIGTEGLREGIEASYYWMTCVIA
jgi:hypothetical protein